MKKTTATIIVMDAILAMFYMVGWMFLPIAIIACAVTWAINILIE